MKYFTPQTSEAQNIIEPNEYRKYLFQRFSNKYRESIRKEVWDLSENNAGISIQMKTNSRNLKLKWNVKLDFKMNHMTDAGIKGLDKRIEASIKEELVNKLGSIKEDNNKLKQELIKMIEDSD